MKNYVNRVYLYGLNKDLYVIRYELVGEGIVTIHDILACAERMIDRNSGIEIMYAADSTYDIYQACRSSMKEPSTENRVIFSVMLQRDGIRLY